MNEQESLSIITNMIDKTKSNLKDQSGYFLMWGWLVLIASALQFALITIYPVEWNWMVWPVLMSIGGIGTLVMAIRDGKQKRVATFVDRSMSFLWLSWSVLLILFFIWSRFNDLAWGDIYVFIIAMYGMATFTTGGLLKFKPLIVGGFLSFVLALIAVFAGWGDNFEVMLLMLALSVAISYLIPGYLLKKS